MAQCAFDPQPQIYEKAACLIQDKRPEAPHLPISGASKASVLSHMGVTKDRAAHNHGRTGKAPNILFSMSFEYGSFLLSFPGVRPVFYAHDTTVFRICKVTCGLIWIILNSLCLCQILAVLLQQIPSRNGLPNLSQNLTRWEIHKTLFWAM